MFVGPGEHLQDFDCPATLCSVTREDYLCTVKMVMCFWQEISHPPETRFNHTRCGESNKMQLYLLCCGGCRGERNIWFTFNFEIMYSGSEVSMAHSESTMSLINLRHFSSGPLGVMWPTFRTTALQWLQVNWMWTVTTGFGKTADDKHKDLFIQKWCCNAQVCLL